jgi:hypothetical protein
MGRSDDIHLSPRQVGDQVTFLGRNWGHPAFDGRIHACEARQSERSELT